jgi:serine phosphatase RsbU (regulator of sigma subunit)
VTDQLKFLADELANFTAIARYLKPPAGERPRLDGIDIDAVSMPLNGMIGGDHLIYVDFKRRYDLNALIAKAHADGRNELAAQLTASRHRAGILLADVAGHRETDALVAAMLHQAFLLGSYYEMEISGRITTRLFEHIKTRFYESTNIKKLVAMLYGEITDQGRFSYLSAGHPPPLVFSREFGRIMPLGADRTVSSTPIGIFPASAQALGDEPAFGPSGPGGNRAVNEIELLGSGDILLLATDGLTEHVEGRFVSEALEKTLDAAKDRRASEICEILREAALSFGPPKDDITFVVIKRR